MQGTGRVLRGGLLVKTARGVVSLAAVMGAGIVATSAVAQELDCLNPPVEGSAGGEMCALEAIGENSSYYASRISADGRVVVGHFSNDTNAAFRWSDVTGMEMLELLPGGSWSFANDVNADGSVVVGWADSADGVFGYRWTEAGGSQSLGLLAGDFFSNATGVNADGTVIVGYSEGWGRTAVRWVDGQPIEALGELDGFSLSEASDVSADGTVVVGHLDDGNFFYQAFRWVEGEGMFSLGALADGYGSIANAVSADGFVIVGHSRSDQGDYEAFRWLESTGMTSLGALEPGGESLAADVNADGTVVVGWSDSGDSTYAFRWVQGQGMENLGTLSGGAGSQAWGVNADGSIVVGEVWGPAVDRAFIWREGGGGMEDYENLILSFPVLANDSAVALAQSQFALGEVMDQTVFAADGKMVMSARAGLMHTERNPTHVGQRDTSLAALSFGYGLSDTVTVGASLGLNGSSLKNNAFDMETGRNIALWGLYSAGGTERTGLQFGAAIGLGTSEGEIARGRLLTDVNLATGSSKVTTRAVEASLGYGIEQANGWLLTPSVTLAHFDTTRAGYTEAGASFNATYDAMEFSRTELTLAVEGEVKVGENGRLRIGGGIEQELNPEKPRLSGTTDLPALPTFDIEGDFVPNKTRPFVTAGYTHDFGNGSSVTADVKLGRAVYGNSPDVGLGVGYGWKF